jgi:hypothetical protein
LLESTSGDSMLTSSGGNRFKFTAFLKSILTASSNVRAYLLLVYNSLIRMSANSFYNLISLFITFYFKLL